MLVYLFPYLLLCVDRTQLDLIYIIEKMSSFAAGVDVGGRVPCLRGIMDPVWL